MSVDPFAEVARSHDQRAADRTDRRRIATLAAMRDRMPTAHRYHRSYTAHMVGHPLTPPTKEGT